VTRNAEPNFIVPIFSDLIMFPFFKQTKTASSNILLWSPIPICCTYNQTTKPFTFKFYSNPFILKYQYQFLYA